MANKTSGFFEKASDYIDQNGGGRLLIGLALVLFIQVFFVFGWVAKKTNAREVNLMVIKSEVGQMRSLSEVTGLDQVFLNYKEILEGYAERSFAADTAGLAAAQVRTVLQSSIDASSLSRAQMTVSIEDSQRSDIIKFVIVVNAQESEPGDFAFFLSDLARHQQTFFIASIEYSSRNRRLNITLEAAAKIESSS